MLGLSSVLLCTSFFPRPSLASPFKTTQYAHVANIPDDQLSIDLYSCRPDSRALVVYVHGGAWTRGDKANVHSMPRFFSDNNVCFASANYPLTAAPGTLLMDEQVSALKRLSEWLVSYGNSSINKQAYSNITFIAHSAGAHLTALTDVRHGFNANVRNLVLMDSGAYDLVQKLPLSSSRYKKEMSQLLDLNPLTRVQRVSRLRQYSPALIRPSKRPSSKSLNVFILTSRKDSHLVSATALKSNYSYSQSRDVSIRTLPWKHSQFPRMIGTSTSFSRSLLDKVIAAD